VFAQGIIDGQERFAAAAAMGRGLLQHEAEATRLTASSRQGASEKKRERLVLSALSRMQRAILAMLLLGRQLGRSDSAGNGETGTGSQTGRGDRRMLGDHRSRLNNGQFHRTPPYSGQGI